MEYLISICSFLSNSLLDIVLDGKIELLIIRFLQLPFLVYSFPAVQDVIFQSFCFIFSNVNGISVDVICNIAICADDVSLHFE